MKSFIRWLFTSYIWEVLESDRSVDALGKVRHCNTDLNLGTPWLLHNDNCHLAFTNINTHKSSSLHTANGLFDDAGTILRYMASYSAMTGEQWIWGDLEGNGSSVVISTQRLKASQSVTVPEDSLLRWRQPASGPYPQPAEFNPYAVVCSPTAW